jgi:hypothetical protein
MAFRVQPGAETNKRHYLQITYSYLPLILQFLLLLLLLLIDSAFRKWFFMTLIALDLP